MKARANRRVRFTARSVGKPPRRATELLENGRVENAVKFAPFNAQNLVSVTSLIGNRRCCFGVTDLGRL